MGCLVVTTFSLIWLCQAHNTYFTSNFLFLRKPKRKNQKERTEVLWWHNLKLSYRKEKKNKQMEGRLTIFIIFCWAYCLYHTCPKTLCFETIVDRVYINMIEEKKVDRCIAFMPCNGYTMVLMILFLIKKNYINYSVG